MKTLIALALAASNAIHPGSPKTDNNRITWIKDALVTTFEGITKGIFNNYASNSLSLLPANHFNFFEIPIVDEDAEEELFINLESENFTLNHTFHEPVEDAVHLKLIAMEQLSLDWLHGCYLTNDNLFESLKTKFNDRITSSMEFPNLPDFLKSQVIEVMDDSDVTGSVTGVSFLMLKNNETLKTAPEIISFFKKKGLYNVPLDESDEELTVFVPKKSKVQETVYVVLSMPETVLVFALNGKFELKK
ncbi:MAG: hypothetical protein LAT76_12950 [Schleiferiaceae bacterium]|nr:hypothetical protein [Schleiferiaceae bacterium]